MPKLFWNGSVQNCKKVLRVQWGMTTGEPPPPTPLKYEKCDKVWKIVIKKNNKPKWQYDY